MSEPLKVWLAPVPGTLAGLDPGFMWAAALVAALAYAVHRARREGLDPRATYWTGVYTLLGGVWGSHLLGLAVHGSPISAWSLTQIWVGGKSYYGGVFAGALAGALYLRKRRLPMLAYAEAGVPAVALGYAIGRIGCFLNGDDYGTVTSLPWAVRYAPDTEAYQAHLERGWISATDALSLPIHPVQLYATLLGLGLCIFLTRWRGRFPGSRIYLFALLYGAARFVMEWVRGDFRAVLGPLSQPQVCSLILILLGAILWCRLHGSFLDDVGVTRALHSLRSRLPKTGRA